MVVGSLRQEADVVVIGGGPGGYVAAIRAADLGREVVLVEEREQLGGVCLLEGCIPSKTLINAVETIDIAHRAKQFGLSFNDVSIDLDQLRTFTNKTVDGLAQGVSGLLKKRGVEVIHGRARFQSDTSLQIEGADTAAIDFKHCIIATGSRPSPLPTDVYSGEGVWTSTEALQIPKKPESLLVIGGGYIGLELGLVYAGLGSEISVAEFFPRLLAGADKDLVDVLVKSTRKRFKNIYVESKVTSLEKTSAGFVATFDHEGKSQSLEVEQVFAAVGRLPNTESLGLENTSIVVNKRGFIPVNEENRTVVPSIFAIGDVTPGAMLAHVASREAKVAAEVIAGEKSAFDNRGIPAVVFTDPEIAWVGLTETEAKHQGLDVGVGRFPLSALGRARTIGRKDGLAKVIFDPESKTVLGVGMVGPMASELIAEPTLAIEMGATLEDLMVTIHPHPTLSESIAEAVEVAAGLPVHINP